MSFPRVAATFVATSRQSRLALAVSVIFLASLVYAGAALILTAHRRDLGEGLSVLASGGLPGVLVACLVWFGQPHRFTARIWLASVATALLGAIAYGLALGLPGR